jgi:hypothetical protein
LKTGSKIISLGNLSRVNVYDSVNDILYLSNTGSGQTKAYLNGNILLTDVTH